MLSIFKKKKSREEGHTSDSLYGPKTPFVVTEAYKKLRTNLQFTMGACDCDLKNVVAVSSCLPGEGKSVTSANLAITTAEINQRVLLIDSDMRKPVQHKLFECASEKGLSTVLAGRDPLESALVKGIRPGLDLLPAGTLPPNPSELLASGNMQKLLEAVSSAYDCVIIDTSPMDVVADALVFSGKIAGLLLVICPDICRQANLRRVMSNVELSETKVLGTVLSNARTDSGILPTYQKKYYK